MNIYIIRENRQNNNKRHMIEEDCRRKSSRALQQKVWKQGELRMIKTKQHDEMDDQLQNKVWDPGILKMECYNQEVTFLSSWEV